MLTVDILTGLIGAVIGVDILDKLSIEQMKRNMLRTNSGTLTTVGATTTHVEGTDDVEHILLKFVCIALGGYPALIVVKHALFAGAGRTGITAGIAANTTGEFPSPKFLSLLTAHLLKLFNSHKTIDIGVLTTLTNHLIKDHMALGMTGTAL